LSRYERYELENFGTIRTERTKYGPLQEVRGEFICRRDAPDAVFMEVTDSRGRPYWRQQLVVTEGRAAFAFVAAGAPGMHAIRLQTEDISAFYAYRMGTFIMEPRTTASDETGELGPFLEWLRDSLEATLDRTLYHGQWVAGDKACDNSPMNLAYPRFRLDSTVYLEDAVTLKGHLELCYAHQQPDGSLYDHIYGDGHPGWTPTERMIRSLMADMETGLIINVWQVWRATDDTDWMLGLLEPMRRGWEYATTSPVLWDAAHGLIKKPHAADEWDCQIGDSECFINENSRFVLSLCDAVRMPFAGDCLAEMLEVADRGTEAAELREFARQARQRANGLLWDGRKYRHHEHLDFLDHGDFDESEQLVMSNTWACNYGLADQAQAEAILAEYDRRLAETGDAYPWWSLLPGYPDGNYPNYPQGVYLNGGLFPWVGGQLCRASFQRGRPGRGWELFREFWQRVQKDGGACTTWYTLDGEIAANTYWTNRHDAWGIAAWGQAAIEGLIGVTPTAPGLEACVCAPQWQAGGISRASACVALPASHGYFAYAFTAEADRLSLTFTGSGAQVEIRLPLPKGEVTTAQLNGADVPVLCATLNGLRYAIVLADPQGRNVLELTVASAKE
jgi:hypothetical protein